MSDNEQDANQKRLAEIGDAVLGYLGFDAYRASSAFHGVAVKKVLSELRRRDEVRRSLEDSDALFVGRLAIDLFDALNDIARRNAGAP